MQIKNNQFLLAFVLTTLFGYLTASAQSSTIYISDLQSGVYTTGHQSKYSYTEDMNIGGKTDYACRFFYQQTNNCLQLLVKDFLVVQCNNSLTEFNYNGLTYKRVVDNGDIETNGNLNYGTKASELYLFAAYCMGSVGETVLSVLDVDILDNKATDTSNYSSVMEYKNGNLTPRDDKDIKKGAGGKYVYLKPTYTTITEASFPMIYMEPCTQGSGTETDPYLLSNAGHLYWFAYMVATDHNSICGKLTADIIVNEGVLNADGTFSDATNLKPWFSIGCNGNHPFSGKLMGNYHTVSGLYRNDKNADLVGLFGYAKDAQISHIGVIDTYLNGNDSVGGIGGYLTNSVVEGSFFQGTLKSEKYCGGISAVCNYSVFKDCYVKFKPIDKTINYNCFYGSAIGQELTNCYYDSDIYGSDDDDVYDKTSSQFASGEVASLLNYGVETGEETFRQIIGTDKYPKFKDNNMNDYVFHTSDGGYTNQCTHPNKEVHEMTPATCVNTGEIANFYCSHPLCKSYYVQGVPNVKYKQTDLITSRIGDTKPVVLKENNDYKWTYSDAKVVSSNICYDVMELALGQVGAAEGTYSVRYPVMPFLNGADLFYQINMNSVRFGKITLKVLVNKVERTEFRKEVNSGKTLTNTIKLEDISINDHLEINIVFSDVKSFTSSNIAYISIGMDELVEKTPAEHEMFTYIPGDDCLHEGLLTHFQCDRCGALFAADTENPRETDTERFKTDEYIVSTADLSRPAYQNHLFTFSQQQNGLYADCCDRCGYLDTESWVAKEAINGNDLHLTGNDEEGFTTDETLELALGNDYAVPVAFTPQNLKYTAPTYPNAWSSWGVPFEVTTTELANAGFEAAYIEGIHRYDIDEDGTIDRTTLEVIRIKNGRLRAGTPYLIHPQGTETDIELNLSNPTFKGQTDIQPGHTETMLAEFDFIPTYSEVPASEAAGNYYIVGSGNKIGLTTSHVPALDWYLTITPKGTIFDQLPTEIKSISICVVGEIDGVTGIFNRYADDKVGEEIYDLSGRRTNAPAKGQLYIQGGKVKLITK